MESTIEKYCFIRYSLSVICNTIVFSVVCCRMTKKLLTGGWVVGCRRAAIFSSKIYVMMTKMMNLLLL